MGDAPQKDVLNASANGQLGGEVETKLASGDCSQTKNPPSSTPIVLRDWRSWINKAIIRMKNDDAVIVLIEKWREAWGKVRRVHYINDG